MLHLFERLFVFLAVAVLLVRADDATASVDVAVKPKKVDGFSEDQLKSMEETGEKHEFQAEVSRLMDIIINSLYTDKQVFLRELISNAADALEKARFYSVDDASFLGETKDLDIKVEFDPEAKTLSITDTGIGMTKQDLINNLGTVAKSGTTNFLEAMKEGGDANLIGQFGVGFYSAFLVADKVSVTSKNNEDETQHVWESSADASFSIVEDPRGSTLGRGSRITLHLKEDALEFMSEHKLKDLVTKFSQFIQYPIYIRVKKEIEEEKPEEPEEEEKKDEDEEKKDDDEEKSEELEDDDEEEGETKTTKDGKVMKTVFEWDQVNTQKALWLREKKDVTEQEYTEFYKGLTKDYSGDLANTHFNAEGEIDFKSILFIPSKAPYDYMNKYHEAKADVKLFVRRVLVAEQFEDLLPKYLSFVKGVVDSDDLPLNVSREQLQQNKVMKVITKKLVRKILELLKSLAAEEEKAQEDEDLDEMDDEEKKEDEEKKDGEEDDEEKKKKEEAEKKKKAKKDKKKEEGKYTKFYKEFASSLKMGCIDDASNKSKIAKLLRWKTNKTEAGKMISMDKYVDQMPEKQTEIYYIAGENVQMMKRLPNMEAFEKKGIEVILLDERIDETCIQRLGDFEGKKLVSVQKVASDGMLLDEAEKKRNNKMKKMYEPLLKYWKETISKSTREGALKSSGLNIENVVISPRLTTSPAVVVATEFGMTPYAERMMKAQDQQNPYMMMQNGRVLEVNGDHPVIHKLYQLHASTPDSEELAERCITVLQVSLLTSGIELSDPASFSHSLYKMMSKDGGHDSSETFVEIDLPPTPEEEEKEEDVEEEGEEDDGEVEEAMKGADDDLSELLGKKTEETEGEKKEEETEGEKKEEEAEGGKKEETEGEKTEEEPEKKEEEAEKKEEAAEKKEEEVKEEVKEAKEEL